MTWRAVNGVVEHSKASGSAYTVLLMLANHAHEDDNFAFPSHATLARETRTSVSTVKRGLDELERLGEIRRVGKFRRGGVVVWCIMLGLPDHSSINAARRATRQSYLKMLGIECVLDFDSHIAGDESGEGVVQTELVQTADESLSLNDGVGQNERGVRSPVTYKPSTNPNNNQSPLNPPEGDLDQFQDLMRIHPGGALGNSQVALERWREIVQDESITIEALRKAASRYADQIEKQGIKACSLLNWLDQGRYQAHLVSTSRSSTQSPVENDPDRVRVSQSLRRFADAAGYPYELFQHVRFVGVDDRRASVAVSSSQDLDRILMLEDISEVMAAALDEAGVDYDHMSINVG